MLSDEKPACSEAATLDPPTRPIKAAASGGPEEAEFLRLHDDGYWPIVTYPEGYERTVGGKTAPATGKEPIGLAWGIDRWTKQKARRTYRDKPGAGVGVTLGPGRAPGGGWLADFEIDGEGGEESILKLFGGEVIETRSWRSTRGRHRLFEVDGERLGKVLGGLKACERKGNPGVYHLPEFPGLELRFGGVKDDGTVKQVQSVAPPTNGRKWDGPAAVAKAPEAFYTALEQYASSKAPAAVAQTGRQGIKSSTILRLESRASLRLRKMLQNGSGRAAMQGAGERHDTLRDETNALAGYLHYYERFGVGYSEQELFDTMTEAGRRAHPERSDFDKEVRDYIAWGKARPLTLPDELHAEVCKSDDESADHTPLPGSRVADFVASGRHYATDPVNDGPAAGESDGNNSRDLLHLTDLGNAQRVRLRHGPDVRFCYPWKQFLTWDGRRWCLDETGAAVRLVNETATWLFLEAAETVKRLSEVDDDDDKRKAQLAAAKLTLSHALKWEDARRVEASLKLLRSQPGIPITPAEMDTDAYLVNVLNGTIDLRTGELREHRRQDRITKLAPVEYDPAAKCPLWEKFLGRIMDGNTDLIDYLRRVAGYSLTADVKEQCLWFFHGAGANGKSTFLGALLGMMGDYACQAVSELLLAKKSEAHPTERADLFGRRFVATIETDEGKKMAEALVKQLTGGDKLKARFCFKDFFEMSPTWKLFLAANHKPVIHGSDHGIWRRIKLVPFTVTITDEEKDTELADKLKAEWPGILRWAVSGCLDWQRDGLCEPEDVKRATDAYQAEQDTVAGFIADCCLVHPDVKAQSSLLHDRYVSWSGNRFMTQPDFSQRVEAKGYTKKKGTGGRVFFHGLGLPAEDIAGVSGG